MTLLEMRLCAVEDEYDTSARVTASPHSAHSRSSVARKDQRAIGLAALRAAQVREASSLGRHHGVSAREAGAVPGPGDGSGGVAEPVVGPVAERPDTNQLRAKGTIMAKERS